VTTDVDLAALAPKLSSAAVSDVLDALGLFEQAMKPFMRPIDEDLVMFGRARTGLYAEIHHVETGERFAPDIDLIDDLRPGEVPVLAANGPTERVAPLGDLIATAARARGAVGLVTDGLVRDVRIIRGLRFPCFHGGIGPLDTLGRATFVAADVEVVCAGVRVRPGDYVFGDADGVVVVPERVVGEVVERALAKIEAEAKTREMLEGGLLLREAFKKHGAI